MFDNAKMIANAYRLKKAVEEEIITIEENGVKISISGDQKIKSLSINGTENPALADTVNKAIRKAQETAALKIKEMAELKDLG